MELLTPYPYWLDATIPGARTYPTTGYFSSDLSLKGYIISFLLIMSQNELASRRVCMHVWADNSWILLRRH